MKYETFNIGPGQTSWIDMPDDYKEAYFKVERLKTIRKLEKGEFIPEKERTMTEFSACDELRIFDALKKPKVDELSCVLHICTCWEGSTARNQLRMHKELRCLMNQISNFGIKHKASGNPFTAHMVISVNGFFPRDKDNIYRNNIKYLQGLHGKNIGNGIEVVVFQRANFGWQWAAFYDVWQKYKDVICDKYFTLESDVYVTKNKWFDSLAGRAASSNVGFVGQIPINYIDPLNFHGKYSKTAWMWRDENDLPFTPSREQTGHTRGGAYFCKKELLQKMDDVYGCFTHALGKDLYIDGIMSGEIGFSQKTTSLGYGLLTIKDEGTFLPDDEIPG